jgi:type III secretion protein V
VGRPELLGPPAAASAIDAELRGGTIDGNEARRRRRQLSRESQFYGSMDGAMKFVKGDFRLCAGPAS